MWKYRQSRDAFHFHICVLRQVKSHWALWWVHCRSILKLTCLAYQPIASSWSIACTMDSHPATSFSLCVSTKSIHGNVSSTTPRPFPYNSTLLSSLRVEIAAYDTSKRLCPWAEPFMTLYPFYELWLDITAKLQILTEDGDQRDYPWVYYGYLEETWRASWEDNFLARENCVAYLAELSSSLKPCCSKSNRSWYLSGR